jgi:hypothetical protein
MMTSIWAGAVALVTLLMVADWYIWDPRLRASGSDAPQPDLTRPLDRIHSHLRTAA